MKINEVDVPKRVELFDTIIASKYFNDNILPYIINGITPPQLVHGSYKLEPRKIVNMNRREKPVDTSMIIHNLVNQESEKKFGVKIRNLLFASQDPEVAERYGTSHTLIPLEDDYAFYYSDIVDDMYASSNGIFSFTNHIKKRGKIVLDVMKSERGMKLQDEIYKAITGSDSMSQSIVYFLYDVIYSVLFYGGTVDDTLKDFNSLEEMYNPENWTRTIKSMMHSLKNCFIKLFEKENVYDIDQLEFRKAHNLFRELSLYIIDNLIEIDIEVVNQRVHMYVHDVKKTQDLNEINSAHEIMCSTGKYAVIDTWDGDMRNLVSYYKKLYQ